MPLRTVLAQVTCAAVPSEVPAKIGVKSEHTIVAQMRVTVFVLSSSFFWNPGIEKVKRHLAR
jgi:hypothetical protein